MAKVKLARSLGSGLIKNLALKEGKYEEGATVDVPTDAAKVLRDQKLVDEDEMQGVAKAPEITGVPEESPVSDENASQAVAEIASMRSKDKLQHIIDNDPRVTVKEAAKKRLAQL